MSRVRCRRCANTNLMERRNDPVPETMTNSTNHPRNKRPSFFYEVRHFDTIVESQSLAFQDLIFKILCFVLEKSQSPPLNPNNVHLFLHLFHKFCPSLPDALHRVTYVCRTKVELVLPFPVTLEPVDCSTRMQTCLRAYLPESLLWSLYRLDVLMFNCRFAVRVFHQT